MSKKACVLTVVALLLVSVPASAQNIAEVSLGAGVPTGDLQDVWTIGPGASASYLFEVDPNWAFGATAGYHSFPLDKDKIYGDYGPTTDYLVSGGDFQVLKLALEIRAKNGGRDTALFFGYAGTGLYRISIDNLVEAAGGQTLITVFDSKTKIGGYGGVGLGVPISSNMRLGGKVQYDFFSVSGTGGFEDLGDTRAYLSFLALLIFEM